MEKIKFLPNVPVTLALTRGSGAKASSLYPESGTQYKWSARDANGKPAVFYAVEELDKMLTRGLEEHHIGVNEPIQITKIQNAAGVMWDIRNASAPQFYATPPTKAAPAKAAPPAKAPAVEEEDELIVRRIVNLYFWVRLEFLDANKELNGRGLEGEALEKAIMGSFIAADRRHVAPNSSRIKKLIRAAA